MLKFMKLMMVVCFFSFGIDSGAQESQVSKFVAQIKDTRPAMWVVDKSGALGSTLPVINREIIEYWKKSTNEIFIIVLADSEGLPVKELATEAYNALKIGETGKSNGVLILHALDQRRIEIETGYGVESVLTDARTSNILDQAYVPHLKAGNFAQAHLSGVRSIIEVLGPDPLGSDNFDYDAYQKERGRGAAILCLIVGLILLFMYCNRKDKSKKALLYSGLVSLYCAAIVLEMAYNRTSYSMAVLLIPALIYGIFFGGFGGGSGSGGSDGSSGGDGGSGDSGGSYGGGSSGGGGAGRSY